MLDLFALANENKDKSKRFKKVYFPIKDIFNSGAYFDISAQSTTEMRDKVKNRIKEDIEEEIKTLNKERMEKMMC